jgi:CHAT domain-containing protein
MMSVPSMSYFGAFSAYYDGDYRDATQRFQNEARGGIKAGTNRWIDSICTNTMLGECYYQMGQHQQALVQYTNALQLFYAFNNWMVSVQFQPGIQTANNNEFRPMPWGRSSRQFVLGHYPDTIPIIQGQFASAQGLVQNGGGVVQNPIGYSIHVQEIVRCTALAMRRRRELMGPACAQDQLTNDLITALSRRPGPPNHWSECWIDLQLGIAYTCGNKEVQARASLERAVLAAGQYDHPMTGMALLELGRLALLGSDYDTAANYFAEASYSAGMYGDPTVVEEALRFGQLTHLMANRPGVYQPLIAATLWAKTNSLRQMNVSMQVLTAECYCVMDQPQTATTLLASAVSTIGRRAMSMGKLGARLNFTSALAAYQQGNIDAGDTSVAQAMTFQKNGSLRLFHIALADTLYANGTVTPRVAMDLYNEVLRDPTPTDWSTDPLEAMSLMIVPHKLAYEHWFEVAVDRKDHERVLEISDLARRHHFLNTLDFGGRTHNLRWLLEGPEDNLDQAAKLQRQDLLARYADYDKLHQQAQQLRKELENAPLVADSPASTHAQSDKLAKLTQVSAEQELLLRQMSVGREPCSLIFPPFRPTKDVKAALSPGQAILSFFSTPRQAYAILMTRDKYGYWKVPRDEHLMKPVMKLLHGLGSVDVNRDVTPKDLNAESWREPARQIFDSLTKDSRADLKAFEQLVIVPDGVLWYLPFEALLVSDGDQHVPLMTKVQIRYAPLVSLGVADPRPRRAGGTTAVVLGKLMQGNDAVSTEAAFEEIDKALPGAVALRSPLPHDIAAYSTMFDGLIVLNEVPVPDDDPYEWSPMPNDAKGNTAISNWFALPWGGPDFIALPSFHTAAERALKKPPSEPGNEVFLSVCALMANGARTILLSRWRTGGQSSVDLVREFVQELPHSSAAEAWQRSMMLVSENPLNASAEPRLRLTAREEAPKADNPFFWAGYLLVDTGTLPQEMADEQRRRNEAAEQAPAAAKPAIAGLPAAQKNPFGKPDIIDEPAAVPGAFGSAAGKNPNPAAAAAAPGIVEGSNKLFDSPPDKKPIGQVNESALGADPQVQPPPRRTPAKQPPQGRGTRKPKSTKNLDEYDDQGQKIPNNAWDDGTGNGDVPANRKRPRTKTPTKSSSSKRDGPPAPIPPPGEADPDNFFPDAPPAGGAAPAKNAKPPRTTKTKTPATKPAKAPPAAGPPAPIPPPADDTPASGPPAPIPPPANP